MRQTLGTGMMAPLSLANNFHGDYYAGPSGAAIGALSAGRSIGDALREIGDYKYEQRLRGEAQGEKDRMRMEDLNQRQAVAQALNPGMVMQSANGMSNRDMDRKMNLPDVGTQTAIYGLQEKRRMAEQEEAKARRRSVATLYLAQGGKDYDGFTKKFGFSPLEEADPNVISRMYEGEENRKSREQMAADSRQNAMAIASMRGGGGSSTVKAPSGYRVVVDENGEERLDFIPGGPADPQNKPENLRAIPTAAVASLTGNFGTLNRIDESLAEIDKYPDSTGYFKGAVNDFAPNMINRMDPKGAQARAALGDLGSTIIHDRSGAAVTASEYPRLRPFIPTAYDDAKTAKMKLQRFKEIVAEETRLYADNFGPDMGYKRPDSWNKYLDGQPMQQATPAENNSTRQKVGPRPGTVIDGHEYLGGDPNSASAWRPVNGK